MELYLRNWIPGGKKALRFEGIAPLPDRFLYLIVDAVCPTDLLFLLHALPGRMGCIPSNFKLSLIHI